MSLLAISYPELKTGDFEWIQDLRAEFCPGEYAIVNPHLTLAFAVDDISQRNLSDHIRLHAAVVPPIDFVLRSCSLVKTVDDDRIYLFLVPDEGYNQILKLHDNLYTGPLTRHLRHDIPYIPHMTIGIFSDTGQAQKAVDDINGREFAIAGQMTAVDIVSDNTGRIKTLEKINLGGRA